MQSQSILGRMFTVEQRVQALLARVESLEHFSNQQSILLDAVLGILEENMVVSTATRSTTYKSITGENM